jgi:hypothetical protein
VLSGPRRRGRRQCPRSVSRDGSALPALLAARLDQLDPPERFVLERGSVEGEVFHHGVVQALTPEEERLTNRLTALVRKELIRAETPLDASLARAAEGRTGGARQGARALPAEGQPRHGRAHTIEIGRAHGVAVTAFLPSRRYCIAPPNLL